MKTSHTWRYSCEYKPDFHTWFHKFQPLSKNYLGEKMTCFMLIVWGNFHKNIFNLEWIYNDQNMKSCGLIGKIKSKRKSFSYSAFHLGVFFFNISYELGFFHLWFTSWKATRASLNSSFSCLLGKDNLNVAVVRSATQFSWLETFYSQSPFCSGKVLVTLSRSPSVALILFNKQGGKEVWQAALFDMISPHSPCPDTDMKDILSSIKVHFMLPKRKREVEEWSQLREIGGKEVRPVCPHKYPQGEGFLPILST